MQGYCDIHNHILPGVDDGARDMDETCRMLSIAYKEGIRVIIATPHFMVRRQNAKTDYLKELLNEVNLAFTEIDKKSEVLLGNELFYSRDIIEELKNGNALTMNGTRYILLEFYQGTSFGDIKEGLNHCIYSGYIPILAHTERYSCLIKDPELTGVLVRMGAYIQISFSSMAGGIWDPAVNICHKLLKKDWVHFIGTDAHDASVRTPHTGEAVTYIRKKFGDETLWRLTWDNPMAMLMDKHI